ncbi:hypothetical protein FBU59_000633 [Linderina macrospora]|uniref:Uncharacterized protein n=1 Tax=Linderina macrospora TaxID=4868 RepID=A0ACC1JGH0_9FUNG|nr:hypothetical protein FBU59_000633 [Linderina macrospora]
MSLVNLFSTEEASSFAKTKLQPTTAAKEWTGALQFEHTFTSDLPGDPVVPQSPYDQGTESVDIPEAKFRASRKVTGALWSWAVPSHHDSPQLISVSSSGAQLIGLTKQRFLENPQAAAEVWSGNQMLSGSRPWAHCYGGHQFGVWAEQLGDGRAISLGEVVGDHGRWEVQFKGAGRTPYSRFADGYAVRRSSIREYLAAEHMAALGIPTSRSLALVFTDRSVFREETELGAIVTRLAPSWVRFGSFELPASRQDSQLLRRLADYVIAWHFPQLLSQETEAKNRYALLLHQIVLKTALMVAHWQAIGFCHGVMNTDNMSVLGLTIDYGPYAFLDSYNPDFICNHSDPTGRYAFKEQPRVALWNLLRLAGPISVLIDEGQNVPDESVHMNDVKESTIALVRESLNSFVGEYTNQYAVIMRKKFGLVSKTSEDDLKLIIQPFLDLLEKAGTDYTFAMRSLCDVPAILASPERDTLLEAHIDSLIARSLTCDADNWKSELKQYYLQVYLPRLQDDAGELTDQCARDITQAMKRQNPKFVLRNWVAQDVIEQSDKGNTEIVDQVLDLMTKYAFDDDVPHVPDAERYAGPVPNWGEGLQCSCSS